MAGFLDFLGFGKKQKTNTPETILPPASYQAPQYGSLKQLADRRTQAAYSGEETPGVGFGPDFVSKTTNPVANSMRSNLQQYTLPQLNSEASKRGLGRSSIALDQNTRAVQNNENQIGNLMSQFYQLNEAQKKTDQTQGVELGQNLDSQYLNQGNIRAETQNSANQAQANRDFQTASTNNANSLARQNSALQAGAYTLNPIGGALGSIGKSIGGPAGGLLSQFGGGIQNFGQSATQANLLGNDELKRLADLLKGMK